MIKKFEELNSKKVVIYHGLGSKPAPLRNRLLEKIGYEVTCDFFDYEYFWDLDEGKSLFEQELKKSASTDLIIGISFGGYLAYHLAKALNKNLVLINPALDRNKSKTKIKDFDIEYESHKINIECFFGQNDTSVPKEYNMDYLQREKDPFSCYIIPEMAHRVPNEYFMEIIKRSKLI